MYITRRPTCRRLYFNKTMLQTLVEQPHKGEKEKEGF